MNLRRTLIVLVVAAGAIAAVLTSRHAQVVSPPRFSAVPFVSRPYVSHRNPITTTWYCPGVPASDATVGGELVITNPVDVVLRARLMLVSAAGTPPVRSEVEVPARDNAVIDIDQMMTGTFVSAVVEIDGGEGMVEQRAIFPAGNAVTSCTTETSASWYFADGWTVEGSGEQLVITNPLADTVRVSLAFFTKSGRREPNAFQGDSIAPHSVKVIPVADSGLVDEEIIGVQVIASQGRLIVGRAQHYIGGNRLGYSVTLGAPAPSEQLWFAAGESGDGIVEQYVIFNPTDAAASVVPTVLGAPVSDEWVQPDPIDVPAGKVVTFDLASVTGLPDGSHALSFATLAAPSVVIERVLTRPDGADGVFTTVVMGMTSEYVVSRWWVPIGVEEATDNGLVVFNLDDLDATVTVKALGTGGEVAVPGLEALVLPARGLISIPLTDPSVFGRPLVVESTQRIFVERQLPRGNALPGGSGSWAMPECGPCNLLSPPP